MDELLIAARTVRSRAYAPYSGYHVGAAIRSASGRVWVGTNVENVSFGATICAERAAVLAMIAEGERRIEAVVVATEDGGTPCGLCLQVLLEFAPDPTGVMVTCVDGRGTTVTHSLAELMPYGFNSAKVERTESTA